MMNLSNELKLSGQIVKIYQIRKTINGLNVLTFVLEHQSIQCEVGQNRNVKCRIYCILLDAENSLAAKLDSSFVTLQGFLSQNSKLQIVFHVTQIKFLDKGN